MSTDTLDAPQKTQMVTFVARSDNQVLTRKKTRHVADVNGERKVMTEDAWRADMEAANDRLLREGKEPLEYDASPWKIQFEGSYFRTDDPVLIDWLRGHDKLGYNGPSGFYEFAEPVAVDDLEPTAGDQLQALQVALMKHDPEEAEVVLMVEQETHNRPQVLKAAESAVASLRELIAGATGDADPKGSPPSTSAS